jgi:hypothetical protein
MIWRQDFALNLVPLAVSRQVVSFSTKYQNLSLSYGIVTHFNHLNSRLFFRLPESYRHVVEEWRMSDVAGVAIALNVGGPFEFGRVWMTGTDIASLQLLELLLRSQLVGHGEGVSVSLAEESELMQVGKNRGRCAGGAAM